MKNFVDARDSEKLKRYLDSVEKQGRDWVVGISKHNRLYDECCSDFSCCIPTMFEQNRLARISQFNAWAARHGRTLIIDA